MRGRRGLFRSTVSLISIAGWFGIAADALGKPPKSAQKAETVVVKSRVVKAARPAPVETQAGEIPVGVAGMQVFIDPETGKLRAPTAEEAQEMSRALEKFLNRSAVGLKPTEHANGATLMDLEGRFLNVYLARTNADGTLSTACVTRLEGATALLQEGAASPAAEEKE